MLFHAPQADQLLIKLLSYFSWSVSESNDQIYQNAAIAARLPAFADQIYYCPLLCKCEYIR